MDSPDAVASHYQGGEGPGGLRQRIETALAEAGLAEGGAGDGPLTERDVSGAAEFHIGGRPASQHLIAQLDLSDGMHVLDVGSGLGGTARLIASASGAQATGIDLTPEFVDVATWLSERTGWGHATTFQVASATDPLPWRDHFDAATMLHVGMNIADKAAMARTVHAALRPGALFAIYDVMAGPNPAPLDLPVPWATESSTSHVAALAEYESALTTAGFSIEQVEDRSAWAIKTLQQGGPPASPVNLSLVMGPDTRTKVANMRANLLDGRIAPTVMVARKQ